MAQNSSDKLIELLNEEFTPQKEFSTSNIVFATPTAEAGEDYDTTLLVTGVPGKGYYGDAAIKYTRISLAALGSDLVLHSETGFTKQDVVDMINAMKVAFLTSDDLEDFTIPTLNPGDEAAVTIQARALSLGWVGENTVTLIYGKPQLASVVGARNLLERRHPGGRADMPSAWAMLYYMDFTSYRDALKIDPETRTYTDAAALLDLTARLGLPGWSPFSPYDMPTSGVPGSNTDFDRVVVQNAIYSAKMLGPIYFHYNQFDEV